MGYWPYDSQEYNPKIGIVAFDYIIIERGGLVMNILSVVEMQLNPEMVRNPNWEIVRVDKLLGIK